MDVNELRKVNELAGEVVKELKGKGIDTESLVEALIYKLANDCYEKGLNDARVNL